MQQDVDDDCLSLIAGTSLADCKRAAKEHYQKNPVIPDPSKDLVRTSELSAHSNLASNASQKLKKTKPLACPRFERSWSKGLDFNTIGGEKFANAVQKEFGFAALTQLQAVAFKPYMIVSPPKHHRLRLQQHLSLDHTSQKFAVTFQSKVTAEMEGHSSIACSSLK